LLLHLGLHLAAGRPWLGKFPISAPKRVLYVDEEMNERTLRRRIKRLGLGAALGPDSVAFQVVSRVGLQFDATGARCLLDALRHSDFEPDVIIVETFRRVLKGSENETEDVTAFWHNVLPIVNAGKTLVVSHHMRKPKTKGEAQGEGGRNRERASGSTDILAGTDTAFAVQRREGVDAVIVECVKSREAEEEGRFVVSLRDEGKDSPVEMVYEGSPREFQAETRKATQAATVISEYLSGRPETMALTGEILEHLKANGVAARTGQRALKDMKKDRRLDQPERGTWRLLAEEASVAVA
jgi:RecA-family ATPase